MPHGEMGGDLRAMTPAPSTATERITDPVYRWSVRADPGVQTASRSVNQASRWCTSSVSPNQNTLDGSNRVCRLFRNARAVQFRTVCLFTQG